MDAEKKDYEEKRNKCGKKDYDGKRNGYIAKD